jgi:hypothetical protein
VSNSGTPDLDSGAVGLSSSTWRILTSGFGPLHGLRRGPLSASGFCSPADDAA